jgi:hypothetical protein
MDAVWSITKSENVMWISSWIARFFVVFGAREATFVCRRWGLRRAAAVPPSGAADPPPLSHACVPGRPICSQPPRLDRGKPPGPGPQPRQRRASRPSRDERLRSSPAPVKHVWSPPLCKKAPVLPKITTMPFHLQESLRLSPGFYV